jgi:AcrR family transcriptional regulator
VNAQLQDRSSGKQRLLDAAMDLFSAKAYASVSSREIALHAEVSLGLIHKHFGGVPGLLAATDEIVLAWIKARLGNNLTRLFIGSEREEFTFNAFDSTCANYINQALTNHRLGSKELLQACEKIAIKELHQLQEQRQIRFSASLPDCAHFLLAADAGLFALGPLWNSTPARARGQLQMIRNAMISRD